MNELQITGTLIKKCEIEKGVSKAGKEYQNRTFVVDLGGQYPKSIAFVLFGDKTSYVDNFNIGDELTVKFSVESREFNDRWFSNINAYSVQKVSGTEKTSEVLPVYESPVKGNNLPPTEYATQSQQPEDDGDGLPF